MIITGSHLRNWVSGFLSFFIAILFFLTDYYGGAQIPYVGSIKVPVGGHHIPATLALVIIFLVINRVLSHFEKKYHFSISSRKKQLHNFCIFLYNRYFLEWQKSLPEHNSFRLTIFEVKKMGFLWWRKKQICYVSRYQLGEESEPKIRFDVGEGAAGLACESPAVIYKPSLPKYENNGTDYCRKMFEYYKLPEKKAKKLNRKASSYLCIPMTPMEVGCKPEAVLCIDAISPQMFYENKNFEDNTLPAILKDVDLFSAGFFSRS